MSEPNPDRSDAPPRSRGWCPHPFYCEENVLKLLQDPTALGTGPGQWAVWVTGLAGNVLMAHQRQSDDWIVWDYHVFAIEEREGESRVWDLDSALPVPLDVLHYLELSFPAAPPIFQPRFRVIPSDVYVREFASDRRHMRGADGAYVHPPPPWPAPTPGRSNVVAWGDPHQDLPVPWMSIEDVLARFA